MASKILSKISASLALILLISLSNAFGATTWKYLFKAKELDHKGKPRVFSLFYDTESVKYKAPYTDFIIKAVFDKPLLDLGTKKPYKQALYYYRIDCTKKLYALKKLVNYSFSGKALYTYDAGSSDFSSLFEDPNLTRIEPKVCKP